MKDPPEEKKMADKTVKVKKRARFTEKELNEEITICLSTRNRYMSENSVEFDKKDKIFKPVLEHLKPVLVYRQYGTIKLKKPEGPGTSREEVETEEREKEVIRNHFNFRNKATQTQETNPSDHGSQIDCSQFPVFTFGATASKSSIREAYEHLKRKKKKIDQYVWIKTDINNRVKYGGKYDSSVKDRMIGAPPVLSQKFLRLCERIVDQNLSDVSVDYSYYDNPADEHRSTGSLLPLWQFSCSQTDGLTVTDIAWSHHFSDLFAVSFKILKKGKAQEEEDSLSVIRGTGMICVYSLKGPKFPEKIFQCSEGVLCLSFHPEWSHLLAAGGELGSLIVYDLRRERKCAVATNKWTEKISHYDSVNELKWLPDTYPQKFCTVSSDGKILIWQFMARDLSFSDHVMSLTVKESPGEMSPSTIETSNGFSNEFVPQDKGTNEVPPIDSESTTESSVSEDIETNSAGLSLSVNPNSKDLFLVGTDTGSIYTCSFDGKRQLDSLKEHNQSVRRVEWNPFHQRAFLSVSDDLTVRIWDTSVKKSVLEYFFEDEAKDAGWAPFSSSLFAVITGKPACKVHVYDLAVDKNKAIGVFRVYSFKEDITLTTVNFHPRKPLLMVGDDSGTITSFKLSPNLRSNLKAVETMEKEKFIEVEIEKMEKVLKTGR